MYFFLKIVGLQLNRLKDSRECFCNPKVNMHDEKIHYKMYKDGKQWAFAAIVTFTFTIVPMTMMSNHAAAASVEEPAVNLQNSAATSSSSAVTLSASAAISHSAAATTNPQSNATTAYTAFCRNP